MTLQEIYEDVLGEFAGCTMIPSVSVMNFFLLTAKHEEEAEKRADLLFNANSRLEKSAFAMSRRIAELEGALSPVYVEGRLVMTESVRDHVFALRERVAALEMQIPKTVIPVKVKVGYDGWYHVCPACGLGIRNVSYPYYCRCGKDLDWSEVERCPDLIENKRKPC